MPNQTVTIKLHDAKTIISAFQVTKTHDQPVTIQAQKGINYELIDDATQFAPENIKIQRVGDDLYISFEADGDSALDPDLIIQGYYGTDGNTTNLLIGLHENGNYYAYVPESGLQQNAVSMLADQMSAGQALGGEALTSAAYEFNPYWLLALIPIVGLAAAGGGGGGGGGGGTPAPSADKPDVVALDGGQVTVKPGSNNVKQVIIYTDESDNPVTLTATKGSDGSWSLDKTPTGVTINPSTGEVTIGMDAVKDGSTVTSTGTNSSNNTATDSDTAKVDDSTPTSADAPDVTALATGAVVVKPGEDNVKQVITYTDESDNPVTLTATKGEDGTWSLDNTPANVVIDPTTGIVAIGPDAVKDGSEVTSTGTDAYDNTASDSDTALTDATDTQGADLIAPTLEISAADLNLAAGESTTITFSFSEAVTGFNSSDVTVTGGSLTGLTTTDNITWTATFTQDGTAIAPSISVADNTYTDLAGNLGTGDALDGTDGFGADIIAPTLEISAADLNLAAGESTTITFSFSEAVTGFNSSDVTVAGGSLTGLTTTDNITWTATFTQDGTAIAPSISVADNTYTDLAGNLGTGDALDGTDGFGADIIAPTLEISAADLNLAAGESTTITFSFSEAVTGFNSSDVTVAGGSLTGLTTTDNITWTATFTQDGTAIAPSISVADNTYTDLAGNLGTGDALDGTDGFGADIIAPTLEISAADLNLAAGESTTITFSFSEAVTGFNSSDVTVAGGSLTGLTTTDNITWTATFTQDGTAIAPSISVADNTYTDLAGNLGTGDALDGTDGFGADIIAPVVSLNDLITNDQTPALTGTVDDPTATVVVTVDGNNYVATNNGDGTWTLVDNTLPSLEEATYPITVTATDIAGNEGIDTGSLIINLTTPILTITEAADGYVNADELSDGIQTNVSLPTGTEEGDIITLTITNPDLSTSTVTHTVTAGDLIAGSVDITIPNTQIPADGDYSVVAQISDAAGNSSDPSNEVDFAVDATVPGDTDDNGETDTPPVLTITEAADGYVNADELSDGIQTNVSLPAGTEEGDTITLTITNPDLSSSTVTHTVTAGDLIAGSVDITIPNTQIPADGDYSVVAQISDAAGNSSDPSNEVDFAVDATVPGDTDDNGETDTPPVLTITEAADGYVNADELSDGIQTNVSLPAGTEEGDTITLTITNPDLSSSTVTHTVTAGDLIAGSVDITIPNTQIPADGDYSVVAQISDAAGNSSDPSNEVDFAVDVIEPIATIDINPITSDNVITLSEAVGTINVSGSVSGEFQIGDEVTLTINNQIYTTEIQSGGVWSVAVSGSELVDDSDLTIEASAIVHDAAGNSTTVNTTESYTLDLTTLSVTLDEALLTSQGSAEVTSQLSGTYSDLALVVPNISLSSQGNPITWTLSVDGKTLTGSTTQNDVLIVTLTGSSNAWSYQVELLDSIDHAGDVESLIFTLEESGSPVLEKISVDVIDDVPILAENVTYDFGDTPSIYFGNAVDSFGADGGHLTTATINGVTYTYDALTDSITYTGSTTQFDPDNYSFEDGVLSLTTNFGDSIRINFQTGEYSVESTGEGIGTEPAQVAPTAMIADQGGLLGSVGLNALDLIDLTANQKFTVADANNDITSVSLSLTTNLGDALLNSLNINLGLITLPLGDVLASLGVGYVINLLGGTIGGLLSFLGLTSYGLTASQDLATELGITITIGDESFISDGSGGYVYGQTITFTLTNSDPVSTQAFNELLASITVDDAFLGDIADLSLAPTYTLNVVDSLAQSDTEVSTDVANVSLLGNLLGSDTSGFLTEGTAGGESIDKSAETTSQRIYGYAGDDTLTGGSGNDLIRGGSGDDTIVAGNGNDLIYGGTGNDELTGNDGTDVFVWEQGDGGSTADPAIDIITDFNTASAAIGGDVLDLSGLLQGEGKIGNLVGNLAAYIHFETVNNQTEIWISTTGEFTGGYDASESSKVDQKIILSGVDYDVDTRTDAEIIQELLSKGKLIVDDLYGSVGSQESLEIDFTAIDNDLDVATKLSDGTSTTTVNLDSTTVEPETDLVDPLVNEDPVAMLADRTLLGLVGVGALGLIDLDRQVYGAYDVDNNIAKVEIQFGSLLTVAPTKIIIDASERLAQELGLKLSYASTEGTLTLLGYSYTLTVTALDGGAIDNVKLNELLATVQLSNENGTLLNSSTLSLEVLQAMQITVTDTNGAVDSDTVASLADANLINSLGDYNAYITEGTNLSETLDESAASMGQRIYAYDGDDVITGSNFNDWIRAGSGDDTVNAGSGNDVIFGGLGNDIIDGGAGNDRILGEAGNDTITGGSGSDTLMFQVLDGEESDNAGGNGTDTWLDFHLGNTTTDDQADKIDISDLLVNYSGDGSAASLSDYLSVNSDGTDTTIRIDRDGAGGQYQSADLVVLKGVDTTLTELITNQQIIL